MEGVYEPRRPNVTRGCSMGQRDQKTLDDLLSVRELAEQYDMGESTAWLFIKRHKLPRYRVPSRRKTTLVRRGDFERAYHTPVPIDGDEGGQGKAAA